LAALLSGASRYVGLDIVPFSAGVDLQSFFDSLVQLYIRRECIPDESEFPRLSPKMESYEFPAYAIDWTDFTARAELIREETRRGMNSGQRLSYRAPWTSINEIAESSLDLVFSQAVLEHVDDLEETYQAMVAWLKPGGYASHVIDFGAHYLSPHWNGHWAYADWEWRLVRGCRDFLLNRQPLSAHVAHAKQAGFDVLSLRRYQSSPGLGLDALSPRFQRLDAEDARTRGAFLILRKPSIG
jgi:SAM-dependent methyltransferase